MGNESEESVEELLDENVNPEYDVDLGETTGRIADFGSLMVALNQVQGFPNTDKIPAGDLEQDIQMLEDALEETPVETLEEDKTVDEQMAKVVEYTTKLLDQLESMQEALETLNESQERIEEVKREYELLQEEGEDIGIEIEED